MPLKVEIWGGQHDGKQFLIPDAIDNQTGSVIKEPFDSRDFLGLLSVENSIKKTEERTKILGDIKKILDSDPLAKLRETKDQE